MFVITIKMHKLWLAITKHGIVAIVPDIHLATTFFNHDAALNRLNAVTADFKEIDFSSAFIEIV